MPAMEQGRTRQQADDSTRRNSRSSRTFSHNDEGDRTKLRNKILANRPVFSSSSIDQLGDYLRNCDKSDINQRDIFGRTLLHIAATLGDTQILRLILENRHIDVSIADFENGWTALHRALAAGNIGCAQILMAKNWDTIRSKDRHKYTPFEVINASLLPLATLKFDRHIGGTELFMFGSNINHTLGFADPDDRARPEMVHLDKMQLFPASLNQSPPARLCPPRIADVKISKLHSAMILGAQSTNNLLVCGIVRGGRLGLGQTSNPTQFRFTLVPALRNMRVVSVALGLDHTVAVTSDGECYTWGSNKAGQLGYPTDTQEQPTPRKVGGELRRRGLKLRGCAASNIHTAVYTNHEIYCWGTNAGQMAFSTRLPDDSNIEGIPRHMAHIRARIIKVCCTDVATVVLDKDGEIHIYMNHGSFRVHFPSSERNENFEIFSPRVKLENIVSIQSSHNGWVAARSNLGTVYRFSLGQHFESKTKVNTLSKKIRPGVAWRAKREALRANDMDIGDNGSIIISCKMGVWKMRGRQKSNSSASIPFKFDRISLINRVVQVRCDSMFESFAAIRNDLTSKPIRVDSESLPDDTHYLVPFVKSSEDRKKFDSLTVHVPPPNCEFSRFTSALQGIGDRNRRYRSLPPLGSSAFYLASKSADSDNYDDDELSTSASERDDCDDDPLETEASTEVKSTTEWLANCPESGLKSFLVANRTNSTEYDFKLKVLLDREHVIINVHKSFLLARCKRLEPSSGESFGSITASGCRLTYHKDQDTLEFEGFELLTVMVFVYDLYTGHTIPVWSSHQRIPRHVLHVKDQLLDIGRLLQFDHLCLRALQTKAADDMLGNDLATLRDNRATKPDLIFLLADGKKYYVHSSVLKCRSAYFDVLLSNRWETAREYKSDVKEVNFTTVSYQVLDVVMLHLYGDYTEDIFSNVQVDGAKGFVLHILEVMELADSLLLEKLVQLCEAAILCFVNVKNAGMLLDEIVNYSAPQLEDRLLFYICYNIEAILENRFLEHLSSDSMSKVDKAMKKYMGSWKDPQGSWALESSEVLYNFVNDLTEHNDISAEVTPVYGGAGSISFLAPKKPKAKVTGEVDVKSLDDGVFSLDLDGSADRSVSDSDHSPSRRGSFRHSSPVVKDEWVTVGEKVRKTCVNIPGTGSSSSPMNILPRSSLPRNSFSNTPQTPSRYGTTPSLISPSNSYTGDFSVLANWNSSPGSYSNASQLGLKSRPSPALPAIGESSQKERKKNKQREQERKLVQKVNGPWNTPSPILGATGSTFAQSTPPPTWGSPAITASSLTQMLKGASYVSSKTVPGTSGDSVPDSFNLAAQSSANSSGAATPIPGKGKEKAAVKLSQKERRKLIQQHEKESLEASKNSLGDNPWKVTSTVQTYQSIFESPAVGQSNSTKKGKNNFKVMEQAQKLIAQTMPSLTDIMKEDQVVADKKKVKKTLEEIQEEERFQRWWTEESAKVQQELNQTNKATGKESEGKKDFKREKTSKGGRGRRGGGRRGHTVDT